MIERFARIAVLAVLAWAIGLGAAALAAEAPAAQRCAAEAPESLSELRPTFRLLADDYDKRAAGYASEAERYRTWASAQDMFGSKPFGELDSARHLRAHSHELDGAAAQSRSLAAKYRRLAGSHRRSPGC
jgi:hypothetical protein